MEIDIAINMIVYDKNYKEIRLTPNDNLLYNADFRQGAINQLGKSVYDKSLNYKENIDMWYRRNANTKVEVLESSIRLSPDYPEETQTIYCGINYLLDFEKFKSKKVTVSINVKSIKDKFSISFRSSKTPMLASKTESDKYIIVEKAGFYTFTTTIKDEKTNKYFTFCIFSNNETAGVYDLKPDSFIEIDFIKIEYGDKFTGFPKYDSSLEMIKCRKYFEITNGRIFNSFQQSNTNAYFKITYQKKKSTPKITYNYIDVNNYTGGLVEIKDTEITYIKDDNCTVKLTFVEENKSNYYRTASNFIIDAKDYGE